MYIACGFGYFCDCVYLFGISVNCFEEQEANEMRKNIDNLGSSRMLCLVKMSDASV